MMYYSDLQANVIYCDSSLEPFSGKIKSNIKYLHLPNYTFSKKILHALTTIESELIALCADDDFILINSLYNGADYLNMDKGYSAFVGRYLSFESNYSGKFSQLYASIPDDILGNPENNAKIFFNNYYQILWAMYPKEVIENAFRVINASQFSNENFIEIIVGACVCYSGGIKFSRDIWGVREKSLKDHWGKQQISLSEMTEVDIEKDFKEIRIMLDGSTSQGYSDIVLNSYLEASKKQSSRLKSLVKRILPQNIVFALTRINRTMLRNHLTYNDNYGGLIELSDVKRVLGKYKVKSE